MGSRIITMSRRVSLSLHDRTSFEQLISITGICWIVTEGPGLPYAGRLLNAYCIIK
jgi:hypothetical protein